jgi:hypothetical protein
MPAVTGIAACAAMLFSELIVKVAECSSQIRMLFSELIVKVAIVLFLLPLIAVVTFIPPFGRNKAIMRTMFCLKKRRQGFASPGSM